MNQVATDWETELFILQGDDRSHLLRQVRDLSAFLQHRPGTGLKDLAWTLNTQAVPRGQRLAVVAASVEELRQRLDRAAGRLEDAGCHRIRDVLGIYFAAEPLYPAGKVALMFPGEGAPYLGMLRDLLPHFPETADVIARCDAMNGQSDYDPRPLSRFLSVPGDPAERAACEADLRRLGNTMFGVLMADWALLELVRRLEIPVAAMAGHSAGELASLWAAGCLEDSLDLSYVQRAMATLEEDEEDGRGTVLLAVGASRETMGGIIANLGKPAGREPWAYLAMDNCPHQTVVVASAEAAAPLQAELTARKLICERLPFARPYHTPLFEPYMGPLSGMFEGMRFQRPHTTLYSCTTARPFPEDPEETRRLALAHWASPVEFTRMVRAMHDDGVRVFVEAGPRGNLTAFVEDILRGRPFLAVPCDTPRRSGLTQLNHLAAQLSAHHVPLRLEHFYARRRPQRVEWENLDRGPEGPRDPGADLRLRASGPVDAPGPSPPVRQSQRAAVVSSYWQVMEQFLDVQQDVMRQYLHGRAPRQAAAPGATPPARLRPQDLHGSPPLPVSASPRSPVSPPPTGLPMIAEIVRLEPWHEAVVRRRLDLNEDCYGGHHTVGGREVSHVHPERNGQPVMPMTFSLEWMAEAATLLAPGLVVTVLRDVQLLRWLSFDEDHPVTVELTARLAARTESSAEIHVQIRDLGPDAGETGRRGEPEARRHGEGRGGHGSETRATNGASDGHGSETRATSAVSPAPLAATAVVEMAGHYPEPPAARDFPLSNERPCRIPLDVLYKNLFHGEYFQGVGSLDRFGDEGIQAQVRVLPRGGLFRSNPDPQFVLDPVLMDVAMHPLAGWHLEQPDQTGRILLPYELKDIRFYGPRPAVGTVMTSQGRIVHESGRRFTHSVDVVGPHGRLWCRMQELKYWRFYLPFGEFNFHGPKDDYFLSESWPEAVAGLLPSPSLSPAGPSGRGPEGPRDTSGSPSFNHRRPDRPVSRSPRLPLSSPSPTEDGLWCVKLVPPRDLQQPDLMLAAGRVTLSPGELRQFRGLDAPAPRKSEWLFGRLAAKDAVRHLWKRRHGERFVPADLEIQPDEHGRPVVRPIGRERPAGFPHVSIAHTEGMAVGAASFDVPVGIDIERVVPRDESFERIAFDERERSLLERWGADRAEGIARFWCAREAVAKALGRGLVEGPRSLAVRDADPSSGFVVVTLGPRLAELFPDLEGVGLSARTLRDGGLVAAAALVGNARQTLSEKSVREAHACP